MRGGVHYPVGGTKKLIRKAVYHWADLMDDAMVVVACLAMYNFGLRVSEAAKTVSDKVMMAGGLEWEKCLDQHTMRASDVMIAIRKKAEGGEESGTEGEGDDLGEVTDGGGGIEWVSAYQWSIDHALRASSGDDALGIGLRVASSKTNQYGQRDVKFVVLRGTEGENMLVDGMSVWAVFAGVMVDNVLILLNQFFVLLLVLLSFVSFHACFIARPIYDVEILLICCVLSLTYLQCHLLS